ncbi:MAG: cytochrome P460 family protein [Candidatus Eisenbacteria bacterium]|uniref:Cytochrome P460 family protein n=1 Tax=Eiseniibacteriota bacterium TaxID=2212470 RepID=A0A956M2U1_UNCEI|nr:cytochrome P460 family protein [Candidatus Eisenbacteria bacterium]
MNALGSLRLVRKWPILVAASLLLPVMTGCSNDKSTDPPDERTAFFPEDFEQSYTMVRDCRGPSHDHADSYVTVWADPSSAQSYLEGDYPFPVGAVIVKVLHTDASCAVVRQYDVMKKGPAGTAPDRGDWLWQEVRPDRTVLSQGVQQVCVSCHVGCAAGRDYTCTDP